MKEGIIDLFKRLGGAIWRSFKRGTVRTNTIMPTGEVLNIWEHKGWGDNIMWVSDGLDFKNKGLYEKRGVHGLYRQMWCRPLVEAGISHRTGQGVKADYGEKPAPSVIQVGLEFREKLKQTLEDGSEKKIIGRFIVTKCEYKSDPPDMFSSEVEFIGVVGEPILNKKYKYMDGQNKGKSKKAAKGS